MIIDIVKTEKILHRKQLDLTIIIHEDTILKINEALKFSSDTIALVFQDILKYKINESEINKDFKYNYYREFWKKTIAKLPKTKLDGHVKIGEYLLFNNIYLIVRNSTKFKNQILEIIYK